MVRGKVQYNEIDGKALKKFSRLTSTLSMKVEDLYESPEAFTDQSFLASVDKLDDVVSVLQSLVSYFYNNKIADIAKNLDEHTKDLEKKVDALDTAVAVINDIAALIHIATQIAAIAAGMMM